MAGEPPGQPAAGSPSRWLETVFAAAAAIAAVLVTGYRMSYASKAVHPGHADPAFFYNVAENIHAGRGQTIDYVWHFLVPQANLHHYAFDYWLPAPSWLMALGMTSGHGLPAAIDVGILMAVFLAAASYLLTRELTHSSWAPALAATAVLIQPGVSWFSMQTDSAIYLAGFAVAAIAAAVCARRRRWLWVVAGVLTALAGMSRTEGTVLTVMMAIAALAWNSRGDRFIGFRLLLAGYLPCIAYFVVQNVSHFGTPFPPASAVFPYITSYEQLFALRVPRTPGALIGGHGWSYFVNSRGHAFEALPGILRRIITRLTADLLLVLFGGYLLVRLVRLLIRARAVRVTEHPAAEQPAAEQAQRPADAEQSTADAGRGFPAGRFATVRRIYRSPAAQRVLGSSGLLPIGFAALVLLSDGELAPLVNAGATLKAFVTIAPLLIIGAVVCLVRLRLPVWLIVPIAAVLLISPLPTLRQQNRSVIHYNNAVGRNLLRYQRQLHAEQACLNRPLVVMTRQPWEFTEVTGYSTVQYPSGSVQDVLTVVRKYGVTDIYDPQIRQVFGDMASATGPNGPLAATREMPGRSFYRFRETTGAATC